MDDDEEDEAEDDPETRMIEGITAASQAGPAPLLPFTAWELHSCWSDATGDRKRLNFAVMIRDDPPDARISYRQTLTRRRARSRVHRLPVLHACVLSASHRAGRPAVESIPGKERVIMATHDHRDDSTLSKEPRQFAGGGTRAARLARARCGPRTRLRPGRIHADGRSRGSRLLRPPVSCGGDTREGRNRPGPVRHRAPLRLPGSGGLGHRLPVAARGPDGPDPRPVGPGGQAGGMGLEFARGQPCRAPAGAGHRVGELRGRGDRRRDRLDRRVATVPRAGDRLGLGRRRALARRRAGAAGQPGPGGDRAPPAAARAPARPLRRLRSPAGRPGGRADRGIGHPPRPGRARPRALPRPAQVRLAGAPRGPSRHPPLRLGARTASTSKPTSPGTSTTATRNARSATAARCACGSGT